MPTEPNLLDHLFVKVDNTDLPADAMRDLVEVTVESSLHLPDVFTFEVHDEELKWVDGDTFALGKPVEISAQPEQGGSSQVLIKGEISALEPVFGKGTHASLIVRGYDRSHRLHRGTYTKAYAQVTDSDLANKIAQEAGLRTQVDSTSEVYDHVFQDNQTFMDFLSTRAQRIGYEFFVEDQTLYFRKPSSNGTTIDLEWGKQILTFRPTMTLVEQVNELTVKGWDPKTKQVVTGQATQGKAEPKIGETQSGADLAASAFDRTSRLVVDRDVRSQADADNQAQAILDELSGGYIEAEGLCYGQPDLRAGKSIKISALGKRFSGTYFVTTATHVYRANEGYRTAFSIHGRRSETLLSLIEQSVQQRKTGNGLAIAVVTNNKDPDEWGRVKLKFPWLADDVESHWARVVSIGAGSGRGFFSLPEVDDEVLVAFENGDFNRPYVLGCLWNGQDKPPIQNNEALENGKVRKRVFKTREGHMLSFTDGKDEGVVLETKGSHKLTLADEKKKIILETANGQELTLDDQGKLAVLKTSGGHVLTLDDSKSEVKLESKANMTIKSNGNLNLEAGGALQLKGQTFGLSANAAGEVKSGATLQIQGALVKIN